MSLLPSVEPFAFPLEEVKLWETAFRQGSGTWSTACPAADSCRRRLYRPATSHRWFPGRDHPVPQSSQPRIGRRGGESRQHVGGGGEAQSNAVKNTAIQ